eukprot:1300139-Rhodomonas_salina.1
MHDERARAQARARPCSHQHVLAVPQSRYQAQTTCARVRFACVREVYIAPGLILQEGKQEGV